MYRVAFFLPLPLRFSRSPRCPRSPALLAAAVLLVFVGRRPLSCIHVLIQTLFTRLCAPLRFFCVTLCAWAVLADRCAVWVRRASVYVATRARAMVVVEGQGNARLDASDDRTGMPARRPKALAVASGTQDDAGRGAAASGVA